MEIVFVDDDSIDGFSEIYDELSQYHKNMCGKAYGPYMEEKEVAKIAHGDFNLC